MTHYLVLHFDQTEPGRELDVQRQFRSIRTKARSWWDYKRRQDPSLGPLTDVRTWEHKGGILHVNWLVRMPKHLVAEFEERVRKWHLKIAAPKNASPFKIEPIFNLTGLLKYICKGTEAAHAHRFGIKHEPQGEIWGRRAGASLNLGRTARKRAHEAVSPVERRSSRGHV